MSMKEKIQELDSVILKLSFADRNFASSIINRFNTRGSVTEGQAPWVQKLIDRANGTKETLPTLATFELGPVDKLNKLFDDAAESGGERAPKLHFDLDGDGMEYILRVAGPRSQYAGQVYVNFGENWVARIDRTGKTTVAPGTELAPNLIQALRDLADEPAEAILSYGRKTGTCAICGLTLTNPESIERGIGPICSDKWGI